MSKNAKVTECRRDSPEFREFALELVDRPDFDLPSLGPAIDVQKPDFDVGFEIPEFELPTKPKAPKLLSPAEQLKMLKDGLQFTIDLKKQVLNPDLPFEVPEIPPVPSKENAVDLALGVDLPEFEGWDINFPDLIPPNYKFLCIDCLRSASDANFEEGDVTIKISAPNGEIVKSRTLKSDQKHVPLLLKKEITKLNVEMTGTVKDAGGNTLQKKITIELSV